MEESYRSGEERIDSNSIDSRYGDEGHSSLSTQNSPSLSPSKNQRLTSSMISNLDLGNDNYETDIQSSQADNSRVRSSTSLLSGGSASNGNRVVPLTARDVLSRSTSSLSSSASKDASLYSTSTLLNYPLESSTVGGPDDSALEALMDAHEREPSQRTSFSNDQSFQSLPSSSLSDTTTPNKRDASFGLDPDADTIHSIQGRPFRPSSSLLSVHRHRPHGSSTHSHTHDLYEDGEIQAPSHTTASSGAPKTSETHSLQTQTVPSVSATGMPRFLPRRTSRSPSEESNSFHTSHSSHAPAPHEMMPAYSPSGSLTLAIFAKGITWRRRGYLLLASIAINIGLPFINGVMLGFGEIVARTMVAPWIGLTPGAININASGSGTANAANTGGAGLRYAGIAESRESSGQTVSIESWEVEPGQRGKGKSKM